MCVVHHPSIVKVDSCIIWDRKSGDFVGTLRLGSGHASLTSPPQVLNISTAESILFRRSSQVIFLDEFRVLVTNCDHATGAPELLCLAPSSHRHRVTPGVSDSSGSH